MIENPGSQDLYRINVAGSNRTIKIGLSDCSNFGWWLIDPYGNHVVGGNCAAGDGGPQTTTYPGTYTLQVYSSIGATGSYKLHLAQQGPAVTFTSQPASPTNATTATFAWTPDANVAYACALDPASYRGPYASCTSGQSYSGLTEGDHVFKVKAVDASGNAQVTTASFTIDTTGPTLQILQKPAQYSSSSTATFQIRSLESAYWRCSLVPVAQPANFSDNCNPTQTYSVLTEGTYRFSFEGTDMVGNVSVVTYDFTVDLTNPTITLPTPNGLSGTTSPTFTFSASEPVTYECSLVLSSASNVFSPCTSPASYSGLSYGNSYRFAVRATDLAGRQSTKTLTWTLTDTTAPTTPGMPAAALMTGTVNADAGSPAKGVPVSLSWTASTDNVAVTGYEVWQSTNGGAYSKIATPATNAATVFLAPGTSTYRFQIKAKDGAGNTSAASTQAAAFTLTLDQETVTTRIAYTGTWTAASASISSGGATKFATAANATATYTLPTGSTKVGVVLAVGPDKGKAQIIVDGNTADATTLDLYATSAAARQIVFVNNSISATGTHTVQVKVLGTKNASSSSTRIDLDGFVAYK